MHLYVFITLHLAAMFFDHSDMLPIIWPKSLELTSHFYSIKILQFPKNGGPSRRSASTVDLFGAPGYRAVSITPGPGDQLVVVAGDGQWVLIDKVFIRLTGAHK